MQKCDWCINEPDCRGVQRSECIVRDYRDFVRESNVNLKEHLMNLLRGHSIDTEKDVEYVADFMIVGLHEPLYRELKPCVCGGEAEFVYPNDHYTDCYLQCIACGNRTENTGGFYYAYEIPIMEAKKRAVELWNNHQYVR